MFTKEEEMYDRYNKAKVNHDTTLLRWFAQFGSEKWEYQMMTNARAYEQYLRCGYTREPSFDEYGWLENGSVMDLKPNVNTIPFNDNAHNFANVHVLQHPNGLWVATYTYNLSLSGAYGLPSIWCRQYPTCQEAMDAAIESIIHGITKNGKESEKKYINIIKQYQQQSQQLSLFDLFDVA